MGRTVANWRQVDLTRAVKAARAVGLPVVATVISPDGTIRLVHREEEANNSPDPFDDWKATRDAR